jgi:hypothetical protein
MGLLRHAFISSRFRHTREIPRRSLRRFLGPDYPSTLQLITGQSLILVLIAQELGQTANTLRKQLSDELKIDFEQNQVNLEALYEKAKTKNTETFIRVIESKDWILGHPEIECLAKIANIEIAIH